MLSIQESFDVFLWDGLASELGTKYGTRHGSIGVSIASGVHYSKKAFFKLVGVPISPKCN